MAIVHVGHAIQTLFKTNKTLKEAYAKHQIKKIIEQKLGSFFIEKGVSVKSLQHKTLYLVCPNASLKSEIQLRKQLLIAEVNTIAKENLIDDIVILNA